MYKRDLILKSQKKKKKNIKELRCNTKVYKTFIFRFLLQNGEGSDT